MAGTFFGINVAQSGLTAQRIAMEVLGQNVAHANDPTYKRQRIVVTEGMTVAQSQDAAAVGVGMVGTGIRMAAIERIRDALIENRMRLASQGSGEWDFMANAMSQLEAALGEPSDSSLWTDLDRFWEAWHTVATSPESLPIRSALLGDATALCARIRYTYDQIANVGRDLNLTTASKVDRINIIAQEIARLNSQVATLSSQAYSSNSLLDRRDALVLELSKIVSVSQHNEGGSEFLLSVGGRVLVQGNAANIISSELGADGKMQVLWASDGERVEIQGGELKAITDLNHTMIPGYLAQMDAFAGSLVSEVNALHRTGKTYDGGDGGDFFTAGTTAGNISLDASIDGHPELVAASATGDIGDGEIALQLALLKEKTLAGSQTINQMYRTLVGDVAGSTSMAGQQAEAHRLSLQQFLSQQQSISGVSLDEEMTNMIKFQQAYNAAARTLSVMDEMLGVLIEKTGIIGR